VNDIYEEEGKATLLVRFAMTDFYVNCLKPGNALVLNEQKYFGAPHW
jgi:hypothetical protein